MVLLTHVLLAKVEGKSSVLRLITPTTEHPVRVELATVFVSDLNSADKEPGSQHESLLHYCLKLLS